MIYLNHEGGDYIHEIVILILSLFLSYHIVSQYFLYKKFNLVSLKTELYPKFRKSKINHFLLNKSNELVSLSKPYGLDLKKYVLIKYILSFLVFFLLLFRKVSIFYSIIFFLFIFFIPEILINIYKRNENSKVINQISNIVQNQILLLSSGMSFFDSLKFSADTLNQSRFKKEYVKFINNYQLFNFNIKKAIYEFESKFYSFEFKMYVSILIQSEKEGNLLSSLEVFSDNLNFSYIKFLKYKNLQRTLFLIVSTIILLLNSFIVIVYPMAIQISQNLVNIFK